MRPIVSSACMKVAAHILDSPRAAPMTVVEASSAQQLISAAHSPVFADRFVHSHASSSEHLSFIVSTRWLLKSAQGIPAVKLPRLKF